MPTPTRPAPVTLLTRPHTARSGPIASPARTGSTRPLPAALVLHALDPDPGVSRGPQAQGDVIVLPWPPFMAPHVRALHTATTTPIGRRGVIVHPSHTLLPEAAPVFWSWWPGDGPTLGTLVVPDGSVARLAHGEHADLRIGPGVYAVRRQRRAAARRIEWVDD
jgi:hypothetical protein